MISKQTLNDNLKFIRCSGQPGQLAPGKGIRHYVHIPATMGFHDITTIQIYTESSESAP
jgi:hypothetical protein